MPDCRIKLNHFWKHFPIDLASTVINCWSEKKMKTTRNDMIENKNEIWMNGIEDVTDQPHYGIQLLPKRT